MPINSFLYPGAKVPPPAYEVANSGMFASGDSAYLDHTHGAVTSTRKNTFSFWVKRGLLAAYQYIISTRNGTSTNRDGIAFNDSDQIDIRYNAGSSSPIRLTTTRVFRDCSAWLHVVVAVDTEQGTASNRIKLYINGVQETTFGTSDYMDEDYDFALNAKTDQTTDIGNDARSDGAYFDGHLAEFVAIDGTQNAVTDFGEFDEDSPTIWKPKDVSGLTFGNAGFYLDFENSAELGTDQSGNSNTFSENNLAATDQSLDSCTNSFATFNPVYKSANQPTYSNGNTTATSSGSGFRLSFSTMAVSTGRWYAEFKRGAGEMMIGISSTNDAETLYNVTDYYLGETAKSVGIAENDGDYIINGSQTGYGASYADGTTIGIALDLDNKKLYASKNGDWSNGSGSWASSTFNASTGAIDISSVIGTGEYAYLGCSNTGTSTVSANFGSPYYSISSGNADGNGYGNFEYAPPSGYLSLCTKNLGSDGG